MREGQADSVPNVVKRRHLLAADGAPGARHAGLTLIVRQWCSLCDTMRGALGPIAQRHGLAVAEVDLDAHPEWESRFGERVPVLLLGPAPDGELIAELRLDAAAIEARLAQVPVAGAREIR